MKAYTLLPHILEISELWSLTTACKVTQHVRSRSCIDQVQILIPPLIGSVTFNKSPAFSLLLVSCKKKKWMNTSPPVCNRIKWADICHELGADSSQNKVNTYSRTFDYSFSYLKWYVWFPLSCEVSFLLWILMKKTNG